MQNLNMLKSPYTVIFSESPLDWLNCLPLIPNIWNTMFRLINTPPFLNNIKCYFRYLISWFDLGYQESADWSLEMWVNFTVWYRRVKLVCYTVYHMLRNEHKGNQARNLPSESDKTLIIFDPWTPNWLLQKSSFCDVKLGLTSHVSLWIQDIINHYTQLVH